MWKPTKPLFALFLAVGGAATTSGAPLPEDQPGPLEGKYRLLGQTNTSSRGPGARESTAFARAASRRTTITQNTIDIDGQTTIWEYTLNPKVGPLAIDLTFISLLGEKKKAVGIAEIRLTRIFRSPTNQASCFASICSAALLVPMPPP